MKKIEVSEIDDLRLKNLLKFTTEKEHKPLNEEITDKEENHL